MTDSLKEVIRVLWLTTPTEEAGQLGEGASGRSTGGAPPGSIAAKVFQAKELLQETGKVALVCLSLLSLPLLTNTQPAMSLDTVKLYHTLWLLSTYSLLSAYTK